MTIKEATERALKEGKWITREGIELKAMIKPTNTKDCCLGRRLGTLAPPGKRWNPKAEDLMADDWVLVAEDGSKINQKKQSVSAKGQKKKGNK